ELHAASPREKFHIDLCGVSFIDAAGKVLLKEIHRQGGRLVAEGCLNQAIVHEIVAREKKGTSAGAKERSKSSHIIFYTIFFSLIVAPTVTHAQGTNKQSVLSGNGPTQVLRLTLDQAVGLALKQNPTAQIAILQAAQSEQPLDTRASDPAGGFAVHRDATRDGKCGGLAIARESGTGAVRPGGGLAEGRRGHGNRHAARQRGAAKRKAAADPGGNRPRDVALWFEPSTEPGPAAGDRAGR